MTHHHVVRTSIATYRVGFRRADRYPKRDGYVLYDHAVAHTTAAFVALLHNLSKPVAHVARLCASLCHVGAQLRLPCEHPRPDGFVVNGSPLGRVGGLAYAQWAGVKVWRNAALSVANGTHAVPTILHRAATT